MIAVKVVKEFNAPLAEPSSLPPFSMHNPDVISTEDTVTFMISELNHPETFWDKSVANGTYGGALSAILDQAAAPPGPAAPAAAPVAGFVRVAAAPVVGKLVKHVTFEQHSKIFKPFFSENRLQFFPKVLQKNLKVLKFNLKLVLVFFYNQIT